MITFQIIMYSHALIQGNLLSATLIGFFLLDFSWHPRPQFPLNLFCGQDKKGKSASPISALHYATSLPPQHHYPPTTLHLLPSKVRSIPCSAVLRLHIPLEEFLSCVAQNIFSVQSHFYSLAVAVIHPSHTSS